MKVNVDKTFLDNAKNVEEDSAGYFFESIVFLYDFLGNRSEYAEEFKVHSELLEGLMIHFDESTEDLSAEDVSVLFDKIRMNFEEDLHKEILISEEDRKGIFGIFSNEDSEFVSSERVAFFSIIRYASELKDFSGAREKFWAIVHFFYGHLGSFVYLLKNQFDIPAFQDKLKQVLKPSLHPEDVYFEFSIAYMMMRQNVELKFVPETTDPTPDFEIYFLGKFLGYLECTTRKQPDRTVFQHVVDGLTNKARQMPDKPDAIQCLAIHMPYDLKSENVQTVEVVKNGVLLRYLFNNDGKPFDGAEMEVIKVGEFFRNQSVFTHLLVISNHYLEITLLSIGCISKRGLYEKRFSKIFPGNWGEGIMIV